MVPPDHPDSNFAMAEKALLSRVRLSPDQVHRMETNRGSVTACAEEYETKLQAFFSGGCPRFDLVLLGMGSDGHTASLFPEDPVLEESERWVRAVEATPTASPSVPRITLSLPAVNHARCVVFLIAGEKKANILRTILSDPDAAARFYPAARVRPQGKLLWLVA
jgi:6-phosphogluconolactonase